MDEQNLNNNSSLICSKEENNRASISLEKFNSNSNPVLSYCTLNNNNQIYKLPSIENVLSKRTSLIKNCLDYDLKNIQKNKYINYATNNNTSNSKFKLDNELKLNSQINELKPQFSLQSNEKIKICPNRASNILNYEIEQFRKEEKNLKEQFDDLNIKILNLSQTLNDLELREIDQVAQKHTEAEQFDRETRDKIEQLQVRKEELDRDISRLNQRAHELQNLIKENETNRSVIKKMAYEIKKCLKKLIKQYENGCRKYVKELQYMEKEVTLRRNRDRELMEQYKQKQNEIAGLLEEKMIIRTSLEERNQFKKLLGKNALNLLFSDNNLKKSKSKTDLLKSKSTIINNTNSNTTKIK